jgi:ferritin-like metal-binding protein YciE
MNTKMDDRLRQKLVDYVQDAHGMELNVQVMLQSMIVSTDDAKTKRMLEMHLGQTKKHADRMEKRLKALGAGTSLRKQGQALMASVPKGMADQLRSDKPGKIARDGYVTEALEIAAYSLLEQLALRCGDSATAAAARTNRADEERMARRIEAMWGTAIDQTLEKAGLAA